MAVLRSLISCLFITVTVNSADVCYTGKYEIIYCLYGCCGTLYSQYCCPLLSTAAIVGISIGVIVAIGIPVVLCICCCTACCSHNSGQRGMIVAPAPIAFIQTGQTSTIPAYGQPIIYPQTAMASVPHDQQYLEMTTK